MLPVIGRLSGSAPSHRDRFSAAFITNIVESRFSARTSVLLGELSRGQEERRMKNDVGRAGCDLCKAIIQLLSCVFWLHPRQPRKTG
jgi:hypothetical protein